MNKGATMKRGVSVSRGRTHPILKRTSHITVQVDVKAPAPAPLNLKKTKPWEVK